MRTNDSPARRRVKEAAKAIGLKAGRASLGSRARSLTEKVLTNWGAVTVPQNNGAFGLENYGDVVPVRNAAFNAEHDADPQLLMKGLQEMGMAPRHIEQVAESVITLFDPKEYNATQILNNTQAGDNYLPVSRFASRSSAATLARYETGVGVEAFGDDINRLNTDDRLTMDLVIMRPWDNIMDKALARVHESSPIVTMRVPAPEAYDWAVTQQAGSTSQTRNGPQNTYKLRDLYRNPTPVNSSAKLIVPLVANDTKNQIWGSETQSTNNGTTQSVYFYKTGTDVSLLDLSRNTAVYTYDHVDRTDLVADGGSIDNIIVGITNPNGGSPVTEYFQLPTRAFDMSMFVISPTNKSSGQRQVMMEATLPLSHTSTQYNGSASTIMGSITDAKIQVTIHLNASLNIQTGMLLASGSTSMTLVQAATATSISSATQTEFGNLTSNIVAYSASLYFDEENQRKANLAVWVQYHTQQFVVPRSRIYFTEYSLTQDIDENAVAATSSIVALGNGRRGLDIIVNALNDVSVGLAFSAANPEIAAANSLDDQSFASSLVAPTVVTTVMDFSTEELNTMNESTRLTEIHGRFRARFLSMVSLLFAKSLMLNQYKGGEVPVIKAWCHSTIADLVIGILDYHPDLQDRATTATGADFSMVLPNGYRLDVIKTNLDCMQQRIYAVPVVESDMSSILSAASIRDCGTVTTNYTPTNFAAVTRRVATTTREIVMMSNKVGICMIVQGLQAQLGASTYNTVPLNLDYTASLAV